VSYRLSQYPIVREDTVVDERWRITVDQGACQGTGLCSSVASKFFELRGGRSEPIESEVDAHEDVIDAAEGCPVEAILVVSAGDGRVIAPEPY
jgi:ferredoxin